MNPRGKSGLPSSSSGRTATGDLRQYRLGKTKPPGDPRGSLGGFAFPVCRLELHTRMIAVGAGGSTSQEKTPPPLARCGVSVRRVRHRVNAGAECTLGVRCRRTERGWRFQGVAGRRDVFANSGSGTRTRKLTVRTECAGAGIIARVCRFHHPATGMIAMGMEGSRVIA